MLAKVNQYRTVQYNASLSLPQYTDGTDTSISISCQTQLRRYRHSIPEWSVLVTALTDVSTVFHP